MATAGLGRIVVSLRRRVGVAESLAAFVAPAKHLALSTHKRSACGATPSKGSRRLFPFFSCFPRKFHENSTKKPRFFRRRSITAHKRAGRVLTIGKINHRRSGSQTPEGGGGPANANAQDNKSRATNAIV